MKKHFLFWLNVFAFFVDPLTGEESPGGEQYCPGDTSGTLIPPPVQSHLNKYHLDTALETDPAKWNKCIAGIKQEARVRAFRNKKSQIHKRDQISSS